MAAQISPVAVLAPVAPSAPAGVAANSSVTTATNPGAQAFSSELTQAYRPPEKSSNTPAAERPKSTQNADQQSSAAKASVAAEGKELPTGGEDLPSKSVASKNTQSADSNTDVNASNTTAETTSVVEEANATIPQVAVESEQSASQSEQLQRQQALLVISQAASATIADSAAAAIPATTPAVPATANPIAAELAQAQAQTVLNGDLAAVSNTQNSPQLGQADSAAPQPLPQTPLQSQGQLVAGELVVHAVTQTLDSMIQKSAEVAAQAPVVPQAPVTAQTSIVTQIPAVQTTIATQTPFSSAESLAVGVADTGQKNVSAPVQAPVVSSLASGQPKATATETLVQPLVAQTAEVTSALVVGTDTELHQASSQPVQAAVPSAVSDKAAQQASVAVPDALASAISKAQNKTEVLPSVMTDNQDGAEVNIAGQQRQVSMQPVANPTATPVVLPETAAQAQPLTATVPGATPQPLAVSSEQLSEQLAKATEKAVASTAEAEPSLTRVTASSVESLAQVAQMQSSLRSQSPAQLQMPKGLQPGMAGFNQAVAEKVVIAAGQNMRVANIQLDPPELGALQIRLQVGADQQVSVSFTSPHGNVRDAVEQSIPRLREMLEEQGLTLGESSVNDQSGQGSGDAQEGSDSGQGQYLSSEGEVQPEQTAQGSVSLVDYYA